MFLLRVLLWPFAKLFRIITGIRNYLYNIGYSRVVEFEVGLIGIGNLIAGGAGKTPMVEYLIRLLKEKHAIATLSRGYGRSSKGYRLASENENAKTIGDEPYQLFKKFGSAVPVSVGEERIMAVPYLLQEHPEIKIILLDDAYQHRQIKADFQILMTEYGRPFFKDQLLPLGRLRESAYEAKRADVIVVSKCPDIFTIHEELFYTKEIRKYAGDEKPVFFSSLVYDAPVQFKGEAKELGKDIVLLTGIANPEPFKSYLEQNNFTIHKHFKFPDHHRFSLKDLKSVNHFITESSTTLQLITTEKDMVRLLEPALLQALQNVSAFCIPVKMQFIRDGSIFDNLLLNLADELVNRQAVHE
ncbi:MAG TPA: tetraacyldisaccharide 4'-kinase [Cyclobacteriaceae bacterium]|nr:tetraacyldisaccharide 4'-kinase [Cyclobacteriaceae bacterium]